MTLVFHAPSESEEVKPFEDFPLGVKRGSSLAILFPDELSEVFLLSCFEAAMLDLGPVYHVQVGGGFGPGALSKIREDLRGFYFGKAYRIQEIVEGTGMIEPGSTLVVAGFPLLDYRTVRNTVRILEIAGEKGLTVILAHTPLMLNELDLPGEFSAHFEVPELFDYLMVARVRSYRGHYRLNVSLLRVPADLVGLLGDHSIPIDTEIKPILKSP